MKKTTLPPAAPRPAPDAALVAMPRPAETLDRAGRANFFHRLSREAGAVAIRAALAAGVELLEARREMAGGFQRWVELRCAFSPRTAYNYIRLAEATLPEAAGSALLEGTDEDRSIEETLDLGWELLKMLPRSELDRVNTAVLDKFYPAEPEPEGEDA